VLIHSHRRIRSGVSAMLRPELSLGYSASSRDAIVFSEASAGPQTQFLALAARPKTPPEIAGR